MPEERHRNAPSGRLAGRRDYALAAAVLLLWLLPMGWSGLTDRSLTFLPDSVRNLYRVACLFPDSLPEWRNYYVQVLERDSWQWRTVPRDLYSRMRPFGHRTRVDFFLNRWRAGRRGGLQARALSDYILARYAAVYPERAAQVAAVRVLAASYPTGEEPLSYPDGRWRRPPLEQVPRRQVGVLFTQEVDDQRRGSP